MKKGLVLTTLIIDLLIGVSNTFYAQADGDELPPPIPTIQPPVIIVDPVTGAMSVSYTIELQGSVISPPREVPDFSLPSSTGEMFTLSEHGGEILLFYFGYLTCPDVCPMTMVDLRRVYLELGEPAENVKVIFITLDYERDTMDRLQRYVTAFHEDFIALRPETQEQQDAVAAAFGVEYSKREVDSEIGYAVDHSATVHLIAPDGRVISQFPYGVDYSEILNDVNVLMRYTADNISQISATISEQDSDPSREYRIVIPEGTGDILAMGRDPGIIPLKIELILGEKDILVLENHDDTDYLIGGIWVAPHETVHKQFYEPQTFEGLCTITVGRDTIEIIVKEKE